MPSHHHLSLPLALVFAAAASLGVSRTADAQFGSIKDRIKQKAAEKAAEKAGKKIGEAMGDKPVTTEAAQPADPNSNSATLAASTAPTSRREWANYDFVPGSARSTSRISPKTRSATSRSVSPSRPARWKSWSSTADSARSRRRVIASCVIPLPEALPQKFTIELDVINRDSRGVAANTFEITGAAR